MFERSGGAPIAYMGGANVSTVPHYGGGDGETMSVNPMRSITDADGRAGGLAAEEDHEDGDEEEGEEGVGMGDVVGGGGRMLQ